MRYLSVCSGIEAATVAWHPLGWQAAGFSEIDKFPSAVLAHHYPAVRNFGDFTTIKETDVGAIDLLVGGTPCQSFSVAGLRGGLGDDRGNLALEFCRLALRTRPRWLVWENVPGVLSSNGGRDFGSILGALAECGYGFAYRVLDAQYFGLAQRRKRVFVVGYLGDWRPAAAVLFERESLRGDPAPRRSQGKGVAALTSTGVGTCGADDNQAQAGHLIPQAFGGNDTRGPIDVATAVNAHGGPHGRLDFESETFIAHTPRGEGFDASEDGTGRGTPLVPVAYRTSPNCGAWETGDRVDALTTGTDPSSHIITFDTTQITSASNYSNPKPGEPCHPLAAGAHPPAVAISAASYGDYRDALPGETDDAYWTRMLAHETGMHPSVFSIMPQNSGKDYKPREVDVAQPLMTNPVGGNQGGDYVQHAMAVRRLTPRECERLQGFPDFYTAVPHRGKPAADGPRYKALGNSMAVPCMAFIGRRIAMVDALTTPRHRPAAVCQKVTTGELT